MPGIFFQVLKEMFLGLLIFCLLFFIGGMILCSLFPHGLYFDAYHLMLVRHVNIVGSGGGTSYKLYPDKFYTPEYWADLKIRRNKEWARQRGLTLEAYGLMLTRAYALGMTIDEYHDCLIGHGGYVKIRKR